MEHTLETRAYEANAYHFFAVQFGGTYVDYLTLRLEIRFMAPYRAIRNADFETAADGYVEAGAEGSAAAT